MASVELQNITKRYGALEVIKGLDLSIDNGSFTALLGPRAAASPRCCG
jgi:ABC-type sugar transport system ATPase subunit